MYLFSLLITVAANIAYHIFQKSIPLQASPLHSLIVTYVIALLISCALLPFFVEREMLVVGFKHLNWASYLLGIVIVLVELGFLLVYRFGWNISLAPIYSQALVTLLLIPIGFLFFHDRLTKINILGIALTILGLLFMNKR